MADDMKDLFEERLGRYQAAIALEPHDRIPIATGTNYFAEVYSGNTKQETLLRSGKMAAGRSQILPRFSGS